MASSNRSDSFRPAFKSVVWGAALGFLLGLPALVAAAMSAGAGHGDYVVARALFPAPMLLTLFDSHIGMLSMAVALLQFPIYGGLLGWTVVRQAYLPAAIIGSVHLVAAILCFSGPLPDFS
jgi:hypothetical protein